MKSIYIVLTVIVSMFAFQSAAVAKSKVKVSAKSSKSVKAKKVVKPEKKSVKIAAKTTPKEPAYDVCSEPGVSSGQGSVMNLTYDYSYHCKQGKKSAFKFHFKFDSEMAKRQSDQSVDIGDYIVRSVADAKSFVYKVVFLKKKTFGDHVEFYIQVPNRPSSVAKLVFCENKPGLRSFEQECNREQYRIDSKDLFFKSSSVRTPSSKKDEVQELQNLFKLAQEIKNPST